MPASQPSSAWLPAPGAPQAEVVEARDSHLDLLGIQVSAPADGLLPPPPCSQLPGCLREGGRPTAIFSLAGSAPPLSSSPASRLLTRSWAGGQGHQPDVSSAWAEPKTRASPLLSVTWGGGSDRIGVGRESLGARWELLS